MKRSVLIAALSTLAAGSAFAQSSVTVYGRLNTTIERQKDVGVGTSTAVNNNASRLGFKGTEDLGGGLKANFLIEHRFNSDDGAVTGGAANFWSGDSWVGLSSTSLGELRLGRMTSAAYYATADYVSMHNHDTGRSEDRLYSMGGIGSSFLSRNKIAYTTPSFAGTTVEVQYAAKETGTVITSNGVEVAVNYALGDLALGGGFTKLGDDKEFGLRALYTLGAFTFGGYYQRTMFDATFAGDGKSNIFRLSGMYTLGSSEFHLNAGFAGDIDGASDTGAKQYTIAYNYNLSKRTKLYTYYTRLDADSVPLASPYADQSSIAVGIRHNF
jgi:predicted porin